MAHSKNQLAMRLKFLTVAALTAALTTGFYSCTDDCPDVTPHPVTLDLSEVTPMNAKFSLGKVLFYDSHLSVNASISCASCHKQALAFSDNVPFSKGFENRLTSRNSLPIQNIGTFNMSPLNLFWDGRESDLGTMVLKPILNHVEMGMGNENDIVNRVRNYPYYNDLFMQSFGSTEVTAEKVSEALAEFVGAISSTNTRFDRSLTNGMPLSALEQQGQSLFFTKYNCNGCHRTEQPGFYEFNPGGFVNIGLDQSSADNGRSNVTQDPSDIGKFKVPDLRNVALTAPYMHDGRFSSLEEVLDHYSHGIANHPNLDSRLKTADGNAAQMNISGQEKTAIIAFLHALTDHTMITDRNFSDPFLAH
jgi:cytochrome c peroxidase